MAAAESTDDKAPSLRELSAALLFASRKPGPIEIYLVCAELAGLEAGVYYFHREQLALRRLRSGDYRPELAGAAGDNQAIAAAPITIVLSAVFGRTLWQDQPFAYRSCLIDCGAAAADLLAVMAAEQIPCSVELGFVDSKVNYLPGIDGQAEAALCLAPLGRSIEWAGHALGREIPPLPSSITQAVCPSIADIHAASSLTADEQIRPWRGSCVQPPAVAPTRTRGLVTGPMDSLPLADLMARQISHRDAPLSFAGLSAILRSSTSGLPADFVEGPETSLLDIYLIANTVEGLDPGAYFFSPAGESLEAVKTVPVRGATAADAGAVIFLLSDLGPALERFGNRGYRALHIEAGVLAEKFSLCARSLGLEAPSLTFHDDEVAGFFEPHAAGKAAILALALSGKRNV